MLPDSKYCQRHGRVLEEDYPRNVGFIIWVYNSLMRKNYSELANRRNLSKRLKSCYVAASICQKLYSFTIKFVGFVTGSLTFLLDFSNQLQFIDQQLDHARPLSQTCIKILTLPRQFSSFSHLKDVIDFCTNNNETWVVSVSWKVKQYMWPYLFTRFRVVIRITKTC